MECERNDKEQEVLGQISHHIIRAGHLAIFGDIEAAEAEAQQAIDLLKSTQS